MVGIVKNPVTLTKGVPVSDLPEDWDEAFMELREKNLDVHEGDYSPKFVATVWVWGQSEFGKDARKMTVVELAEFWYEFA